MKPTVELSQLQDEKYQLLTDSQDLSALFEHIGLPQDYTAHITAAIVEIVDGDYQEVYLSESSRYYNLTAWYHPLPYYMNAPHTPPCPPIYWQEETYP